MQASRWMRVQSGVPENVSLLGWPDRVWQEDHRGHGPSPHIPSGFLPSANSSLSTLALITRLLAKGLAPPTLRSLEGVSKWSPHSRTWGIVWNSSAQNAP